ncbi:MAG: hypothetical protein DSY74_02315 [Actinobacteria bacterium]|uniref:ABC transporter substrate-binding protein n=1 Tax=Microbacterium sp. NPDC076895 TaxID=3154957 RepID=UPI000FFFE107|nr:MAG: hypothetical protein DSY74_02315 [Actinomycetota bacterium]
MNKNGMRLVGIASAVVLGASLVACSNDPSGVDDADGEKEPIRIAFIAPESGALATLGEDQRAALEFAVKEANANGGVDGRRVEFVTADNRGTPEGTVSAAQRLVREENAPFITGPVASPDSLALIQQLKALDALYVGAQSQGNALTGESCNPRYFRATYSDSMVNAGLEIWASDRPERDWETIGSDYSYGRDSTAEFARAIDELGGTARNDVFAPLGTTDFAPFLDRLAPAEGLLTAIPGNDAVTFFQQGLQFGAFDQYETVVSNSGMNTTTIAAVGEGTIGFWGAVTWSETLDTPATKAFVDAYREETGDYPGSYVGQSYTAIQMLFAGIEKAGSIDRAEVAKAMQGMTFQGLQGELTVRADDNQLLVPVVVSQVEEIDGRLQFAAKTVIPGEDASPSASPDCTMTEP